MSRVNKKDVQIDFEPLNRLVRSLTADYAVRVGIFGNKNSRDAKPSSGNSKATRSVPTNAEVGVQHEFGVPGRIPIRSFLRMPIQMKSKEIIAQSTEGKSWAKMMVSGNAQHWLRRIGIACENAIQEAFDTKGFGTWPENAYSTIMRHLRKGSLYERQQKAAETMFEGAGFKSPLIDTSQLRRSITSKVVKA